MVTQLLYHAKFTVSSRNEISRASFFNNLLLYFWLCCIFIAAWALSLVVKSGDCSPVAMRGLLTAVASLGAGFPGGSDGKESACSAGDPGSIPGSGTSPEEGNSNPLQYPCLENSMDGGAWQATVYGVTKSRT